MTVSLECLMQCEDVSVAFSLEAPKVSWRWHVSRNGIVSMNCAVPN
jgi:hypothetical protein